MFSSIWATWAANFEGQWGVNVLEQEQWGWWLCHAHTKLQFFFGMLDIQ